MSCPLKILHFEDNLDDAELVKMELQKADFEFTINLVTNYDDFLKELKGCEYDIVLSDYSLPTISGKEILPEVKKLNSFIPLLFVSGAIQDTNVDEVLKKGATDYILKDHLERLIPAIKRAVREIEEKKKRHIQDRQIAELQQKIQELERIYEELTKRVRGFLKIEIPSGKYLLVDKFLEDMSGYKIDKWETTPHFIQTILHPDFTDDYSEKIEEMANGIVPSSMEYKIIRKNEETRWWMQVNIGAFDLKGDLTSISAVIIDHTDFKRSQLKYRLLFENALVGMYQSDLETGDFVEANKKLADILGAKSAEELKNENALTFHLSRAIRDKYVKKLKEQGSYEEEIYEIKRKDGQIITITESARLLQEEGYMEGMIKDITERVKAEKAINRNREAFQLIAETALQSSSITDLCQKIIQGLAEILNFRIGSVRIFDPTTETLVPIAYYLRGRERSTSDLSVVSLDDDSHLGALVARTKTPIFEPDSDLENSNERSKEITSQHGLRANITWPIITANNELLGTIQLLSREPKMEIEGDRNFFETIAGMLTSAIEQKRAEQKKRELSNIVETSDDVVISTDEDGIILYANPAIDPVLGYQVNEIIGKNIRVLNPPGIESFDIDYSEKPSAVSEKRTFETNRRHKNGSLIPAIVTISPMYNENNEIISINHLIVDISPLRELKETLQRRIHEFTVLNQIISLSNRTANIEDLMDITLNIILNALDFSGGAIYLIRKQREVAEMISSLGISKEIAEEMKELDLNSQFFQKVFIQKQSIVSENFMAIDDSHKRTGFHTFIAVPFHSMNQVNGALIVTTRTAMDVSEEIINMLEVIGREFGSIIDKMLIEEELEQSKKDIQVVFDTIIDFLIVADIKTGEIVFSSTKAQDFLGYSKREFNRLSVTDILSKTWIESTSTINELIGKIKEATPSSIPLVTKEEEIKNIHVRCEFSKLNDREIVIAYGDLDE
jgi:PAS domain S-box-containing protein